MLFAQLPQCFSEEAQVSKNCPRANGFFAFPAEESCQKFWDCRGGKSYLQECPVGVIFDPKSMYTTIYIVQEYSLPSFIFTYINDRNSNRLSYLDMGDVSIKYATLHYIQ